MRVYVCEVWPSPNTGAKVPWCRGVNNWHWLCRFGQEAVSAAASRSGLNIGLIPAGQAMGRLGSCRSCGRGLSGCERLARSGSARTDRDIDVYPYRPARSCGSCCRSPTADPCRNRHAWCRVKCRDIFVVREDCAALLGAGGVFNPDWLPRICGIRGVRLMDWIATNTSTLKNADDRLHLCPDRRAMDIMVAVANEPDADPRFTGPHPAEDALMRDLAQIARGRPETQPARSCRIFQRGLEPAVRSGGLTRCTSHGALES